MYTLTKVDQGVANGDDKIAEIVAQSKENAVNPNPVKPASCFATTKVVGKDCHHPDIKEKWQHFFSSIIYMTYVTFPQSPTR